MALGQAQPSIEFVVTFNNERAVYCHASELMTRVPSTKLRTTQVPTAPTSHVFHNVVLLIHRVCQHSHFAVHRCRISFAEQALRSAVLVDLATECVVNGIEFIEHNTAVRIDVGKVLAVMYYAAQYHVIG